MTTPEPSLPPATPQPYDDHDPYRAPTGDARADAWDAYWRETISAAYNGPCPRCSHQMAVVSYTTRENAHMGRYRHVVLRCVGGCGASFAYNRRVPDPLTLRLPPSA